MTTTPRPQVIVRLRSAFGDAPGRKIDLPLYVEQVYAEQPNDNIGVIESMQNNLAYHGECMGRLLECLALGDVNFRAPETINHILFGYPTAGIHSLEIVTPTPPDDDIPF